MEKAANKIKAFRFERKFVISGFYNKELISMIKVHPAMFTEIFQERLVNNIYFDTHNFKNYRDNIDGCADRVKARIRWYGPLFGDIKKPVLEFKIKSALVGKKESYKLKKFTLNENFDTQTISCLIDQSKVPDQVKEDFKKLQPTLLNRYRRRYFMSANKQYRVTIDKDMEYYNIKSNNNFFVHKFKDQHATIIELKYASDLDNTANDIASLFPFRMTKSSKYVNGVDRFFGSTI